jgi:Holliday junction resolvase RusA-like endonuclease
MFVASYGRARVRRPLSLTGIGGDDVSPTAAARGERNIPAAASAAVDKSPVNARCRSRIRSKRYASWHNDAGWRIRAAKVPKVPGRIVVTVRAALPNRPRDLDNIVKPLLDALTTFNVIDDDKLVTRLAAEWAAADAPGMVEIHVRQFGRWGWSRPSPNRYQGCSAVHRCPLSGESAPMAER